MVLSVPVVHYRDANSGDTQRHGYDNNSYHCDEQWDNAGRRVGLYFIPGREDHDPQWDFDHGKHDQFDLEDSLCRPSTPDCRHARCEELQQHDEGNQLHTINVGPSLSCQIEQNGSAPASVWGPTGGVAAANHGITVSRAINAAVAFGDFEWSSRQQRARSMQR